MKKRLILLAAYLSVCFGLFAATNTNTLVSYTFLVNYMNTNTVVSTSVSNYIYSLTSSVPVLRLYSGISTNLQVSQANATNWWCFTNGVLLRITNNVP